MDLSKKVKLALDETRMLILGAQILLGFQFRGVFSDGSLSRALCACSTAGFSADKRAISDANDSVMATGI
jgi:hypothetical protein